MHNIPAIVEEIPTVAVHADMGPHNVILSPTTTTDINAIIDFEFVGSAPYASLHRIIEMLFRESASNGFGAEYSHADELRDAFWGRDPGVEGVECERSDAGLSRMAPLWAVYEGRVETG